MSRYDNYIPEIIDEEIDNNINRDIEESGEKINNIKSVSKRNPQKDNSKSKNNKINTFFTRLKTPAIRYFLGITFNMKYKTSI